MFDYKAHFSSFCEENGLDLSLSFDMPEGYGTANGLFDPERKTVFINAALLESAPDGEKAFYFFHELRHAAQYLLPDRFPDLIRRSLRYVIRYDGTCYKQVGDDYAECRLEGGEAYFTRLYLGQPHEADANAFAFGRVRELFGDSEALDRLYGFWMPEPPVPDETYETVWRLIDEKLSGL